MLVKDLIKLMDVMMPAEKTKIFEITNPYNDIVKIKKSGKELRRERRKKLREKIK